MLGHHQSRLVAEQVEPAYTLPQFGIDQLADCKLVIVDPIGSYLGGRTDAHRDNEVRAVLTPLAALAARRGVAVVVVCVAAVVSRDSHASTGRRPADASAATQAP